MVLENGQNETEFLNLQKLFFGGPTFYSTKFPTNSSAGKTLKLTFRHGDKQQRRAMSIIRIQVDGEGWSTWMSCWKFLRLFQHNFGAHP